MTFNQPQGFTIGGFTVGHAATMTRCMAVGTIVGLHETTQGQRVVVEFDEPQSVDAPEGATSQRFDLPAASITSTWIKQGPEVFPGATREEIASIQLSDLVGSYESPDDVPEWVWLAEHASFEHMDGNEFVLNTALDFSDAPARLKPIIKRARELAIAYIIFHQGT